jgi:hypothetical protein
MTESNIDGRLYSSDEIPQEIAVDSWLRWQLELSAIPGSQRDEYLVPVKNVRPCPVCGEGTALVRMGRELRILDAIYDRENSEPFNRRWNANVLAEHDCGARR